MGRAGDILPRLKVILWFMRKRDAPILCVLRCLACTSMMILLQDFDTSVDPLIGRCCSSRINLLDPSYTRDYLFNARKISHCHYSVISGLYNLSGWRCFAFILRCLSMLRRLYWQIVMINLSDNWSFCFDKRTK